MTGNPDNAESRKLPVLPSSARVERLREDARPGGLEKNLADRTVIDDALDDSLTPRQRRIREAVVTALRTVYDPEIPVNIFDLGLIYAIDISDNGEAKVRMTLTAPGCPVAATFPGEVQRKIESVEGVSSATVELVWDPPWTKDRMSEAAMLELGLL